MGLLDILGKSVLSRGNSQCKGCEAGVCLVWIGKSKEASVYSGMACGKRERR